MAFGLRVSVSQAEEIHRTVGLAWGSRLKRAELWENTRKTGTVVCEGFLFGWSRDTVRGFECCARGSIQDSLSESSQSSLSDNEVMYRACEHE